MDFCVGGKDLWRQIEQASFLKQSRARQFPDTIESPLCDHLLVAHVLPKRISARLVCEVVPAGQDGGNEAGDSAGMSQLALAPVLDKLAVCQGGHNGCR